MFSFMFSVFQYTAIFRKRKSFYPIPAIAVSSFSTPASAITSTGFHFVFPKKDQADHKDSHHRPAGVRQCDDIRPVPEGRYQNRYARRRDHRHNRRSQRLQDALQQIHFLIFQIHPGK